MRGTPAQSAFANGLSSEVSAAIALDRLRYKQLKPYPDRCGPRQYKTFSLPLTRQAHDRRAGSPNDKPEHTGFPQYSHVTAGRKQQCPAQLGHKAAPQIGSLKICLNNIHFFRPDQFSQRDDCFPGVHMKKALPGKDINRDRDTWRIQVDTKVAIEQRTSSGGINWTTFSRLVSPPPNAIKWSIRKSTCGRALAAPMANSPEGNLGVR